MTSFYSQDELLKLGFKRLGKKVSISRNARFYGIEKIELGDNVRIDDLCILSGNIIIGSHIHISAAVHMFAGSAGIELKDFATVSGRCSIYAITDDYLGSVLTNSTIPDEFKKVTEEKVILEKHAIIGAGCTVLPGVTLGEGTAIGAHSLVTKSTEPFGVYAGIPAKRIKERSRELLNLEKQFLLKWTAEYASR